jgi:hydroxymethylbilane synthase
MRDGKLYLDAIVARPDGTKVLHESRSGDDPIQLGEAVGETLLQQGGAEILEEVYGQNIIAPQQP